MANPTWPSSLGCPLFEGFAAERDEGVIRSQMDAALKKRRRYTAIPQKIAMSVMVDEAQMQTLEDFYEVTLKRVLPFDWRHWLKPDTSPLVPYQFDAAPSYTPVSAGRWKANLQFLVLSTFQGTHLLDVYPLTT